MTNKRLMRTLSGKELEALVGASSISGLAEDEIKRREKRRSKRSGKKK